MSQTGIGRDLAPYEPEPAIRVGLSTREQNETRWGLVLVIFMRLLAALWVLQGLLVWASFMMPRMSVFDHMGKGHIAAVAFFSVIDFLAAVGLWLATPWGGVLWLFAAVAQVLISVATKHGGSIAWTIFDLVLIALYFALTWQAARTSRHAQSYPLLRRPAAMPLIER